MEPGPDWTPRERELWTIIQRLERRIIELEAEVARVKKDSSNSSKPPSSDIVKPPRPEPKGRGKIGGQPGHPRHERSPFGPDQIDKVEHHTLDRCPGCGGRLRRTDRAAQVVQQVELVAKPVCVTEHRAAAYRCGCCGKSHTAGLPAGVERGGLLGPRLTALVAHLKGAGHASYTTVQTFLGDVAGVSVSTGLLAKAIGKVSAALEAPYAQLAAALATEPRLNVDETGHKDNGQPYWTWCFRAAGYTVFKIDKSRGSDVLIDVLGREFAGVLGCDYFSAYRKYMGDCGVPVQFCLAHLIREVKFLAEHPDKRARVYGARLLQALRDLFHVIHRRQSMSRKRLGNALERKRDQVILAARCDVPAVCEAQNLARRFEKNGAAYFRFITTPGIEPTNNLAEQAIRFVVIDRKVTQGTRGRAGQAWCERIWTTLATCVQQGRSAFRFLIEAIEAYFNAGLAPSLLRAGP